MPNIHALISQVWLHFSFPIYFNFKIVNKKRTVRRNVAIWTNVRQDGAVDLCYLQTLDRLSYLNNYQENISEINFRRKTNNIYHNVKLSEK